MARLRKHGFHPSAILDVGANAGVVARELLWGHFGNIPGHKNPHLLLIEGSQRHTSALLATGFEFNIAVLGARTQEIDFYDNPAAHTGNSVLKENTKYFAGIVPSRVVMRTLDELVGIWEAAHSERLHPQLLKVDVQGCELEVLKGARRVLESVDVMLMETSVLPYNAGAPLTADVLSFVDTIGFQVLAVPEMHYLEGVLIQIDFVFVKKGSFLIRSFSADAGLVLPQAGAATRLRGR